MQGYSDYVEKLACFGSDELIFNSGPVHAAIVMSRIFKYSMKEVKIFCGGFNGAVSNDYEYLYFLEEFLKRKGTRLSILAEADLSNNNTSKVYELLKKYSDKVTMYKTPHKVRYSIDNDKIANIHFTVGDNKMLRLETNTDEYIAQVNFGNEDSAGFYKSIFQQIWDKSTVDPLNRVLLN